MKKNSSGDFDILGPNNPKMQIGDSDDDGVSLILGPVAIVEIFIDQTGITDVQIRYEKIDEKLLKIKMPLGIPVKFQLEILASLGIKIETKLLTVSAPLAITKEVLLIVASAPLRSQWKIRIQVDRNNNSIVLLDTTAKTGKTRSQTVKSLRELRRLLREEC